MAPSPLLVDAGKEATGWAQLPVQKGTGTCSRWLLLNLGTGPVKTLPWVSACQRGPHAAKLSPGCHRPRRPSNCHPQRARRYPQLPVPASAPGLLSEETYILLYLMPTVRGSRNTHWADIGPGRAVLCTPIPFQGGPALPACLLCGVVVKI